MDFAELNEELTVVSHSIAEKNNGLQKTRTEWLTKKAEYEMAYSRVLLETKIKNPEMTQSEIKAQATCLSYQARLDCILAESNFRQLMGEINALRDRLEALREISFNIRQETRLTSQYSG